MENIHLDLLELAQYHSQALSLYKELFHTYDCNSLSGLITFSMKPLKSHLKKRKLKYSIIKTFLHSIRDIRA